MTLVEKTQNPPPNPCPLDDCLCFIEMTWVPKIMWYLKGGPRRFGALRRDVDGISAKVLTDRLRFMSQLGIVTRAERPGPTLHTEYELTELGRAFDPVFDAMSTIGARLRAEHPHLLPAAKAKGKARYGNPRTAE